MKIVFMGTPEFAVPILDSLNKKYEIELVVSQPDRAKKKGEFIKTPVAKYAIDNNLELFQPEKIKDDYEKIMNCEADLLVSAAYGQYIPSFILNKFKKTINVHGSLLPKHRGGAPIQRAIMEGDLKTGVTIMQMSKKLDGGLMYAKEEYIIKDDDDSSSVFQELSNIGAKLLMDNILDIYNDINKGEIQNEEEATYSPNILASEEKIDINDTSKNIINKIRALSKNPGAYLDVKGTKIKIFKASIIQADSTLVPGMVISTKKGIVIKTKDAAISLDLVLVPGKKIISGRDFSNGQKFFIEGEVI